jgi:hypothetical protein
MAELKTKSTDNSVEAFLNSIADEQKKSDSYEILKMMHEASGEEPKMWGDSIVGFGQYTYKYASGRSGEWMRIAFSPRKQNLTIYIMPGFDIDKDFLKDLGKFKTGKSCLYVKKLDDIDRNKLRKLIDKSLDFMNEKYPQ